MEKNVHSKLPQDLGKLLGVQSQDERSAEAFTSTFLKKSLPSMGPEAIQQALLHKPVVLEYQHKRTGTQRRARARGLTARQRRELRLFHLKPEHQKYELFLPLHEIWKQYIRDLCCGLKPERCPLEHILILTPQMSLSNPQMIQTKLLKADFHGAIISVVRSKCPSYVGATGILVQELKHVFKIITQEDELKVIPKRNSVFSVEVDGFVSHIYGTKFQLRSSERSAKKFKAKGTIDL